MPLSARAGEIVGARRERLGLAARLLQHERLLLHLLYLGRRHCWRGRGKKPAGPKLAELPLHAAALADWARALAVVARFLAASRERVAFVGGPENATPLPCDICQSAPAVALCRNVMASAKMMVQTASL